MNQWQWLQIIWAAGVLILAVGALTSYRLNWRTSIRYALIWAGIFLAVTLFIDIVK
ncbi:MAG: hypothetical protein KC496_13905 [Anaerolineae bacterium]|nr:hypothetical protein [Anaerolineae bacterium]